MAIWEWIGSSADAVRRDAKPVTNACRNIYSCGGAAFTKIDQAVRINGLYRLGQWMPDEETKSKIGLYTSKFAKNSALYALQEGYKLIPGGVAVSKIVSKTIKDVRYENEHLEQVKKKKEAESAEEELSGVAEAADKSPKDVIRVFMMKEFFGTRFFDDLMVSQIATKKRKK